MPSKDDLQRLVRRVYQESQRRSPLAGALNFGAVAVEKMSLEIAGELAAVRRVPRGVKLRYATEGIQPTINEFANVITALRQLAVAPQINRLNYIRQLSTTAFSTSIGGTHTRLEHTLGAFDCAIRLLAVANDYMAAHEQEDSLYATHRQDIACAVLTLAFFHDAFHAPFGHVLDPLRRILLPQSQIDRIDNSAKLLDFKRAQQELDGIEPEALSSIVLPLLRHVYPRTDQLRSVVAWCVDILDCYKNGYLDIPDRFLPIAFAFDILWSAVDHDRLDYVDRDEAHLLVFNTPQYRVIDLTGSVVCMRRATGEVRLAFHSQAGTAVHNLLLRRQTLYNLVSRHA